MLLSIFSKRLLDQVFNRLSALVIINNYIYIYLLKNSLAVKKGAALFKMASVKKVVKSKERPRNGCDGIG